MYTEIYQNLKYIIAGEWCLLLLAFGLLIFRKQVFEGFDVGLHLVGHLLASVTAIAAFIGEALLVLGGNLGTHGSLYLLNFYAEHFEPWLLFMLLYNIVCFIFERIFFIINSDYSFGRRFLLGARIVIFPHESKNLISPKQRIVLIQ